MILGIAYIGVGIYLAFAAAMSHVLPDVKNPTMNPPAVVAPAEAASAPEAK